jgi:hypothetical protein
MFQPVAVPREIKGTRLIRLLIEWLGCVSKSPGSHIVLRLPATNQVVSVMDTQMIPGTLLGRLDGRPRVLTFTTAKLRQLFVIFPFVTGFPCLFSLSITSIRETSTR